MTNPMSELERLTSPAEARKAEDERSRSSFRPPFTSCTCDFGAIVGPYESELNNGQKVQRVAVKLLNMRNVKGVTPFTGTDFDLELGIGANPNPHSEVVLMVESAAAQKADITSIIGLQNLKNVSIEERVHSYSGNRFVENPNGQRTNRDGKRGDWQDTELTTRYYHIVSIGKTAEVAPPVALSASLVDAALGYLNGRTEAEFRQGVMQDEAVKIVGQGKPDEMAALMMQAAKGQFLATAVENGAVVADTDGKYVRQMLLPTT